jgi:sec-independent protein translocase protein TatA
MATLLIGDIGTPELVIVLVVVMLVFGGSKLPELARGSGRALRIFKSEVNGLDAAASAGAEGDIQSSSGPVVQDDLDSRQAAERASLEERHAAERRDLGLPD